MDKSQYFKDLKVIELASVLAGPSVGLFFAELGAKVIKVENKLSGGDITRRWKLPEEDQDNPFSAYYYSINWNKEIMMMDLSDPADLEVLLELVKDADILIANFKAGAAEKLGVGYDDLKSLNPKLIYSSVNAYGESDPRPGFDVVMQAETGWIYMNGETQGLPVKMPVALMDVLAGHQLKEGVLLALLDRERTGLGCKVSISLFDTGVASLANQATNWLNLQNIPQRLGSRHPNIAPYGDTFYTADNKALIVSTGTTKQWQGLCEVLGIPELITDPRFIDNGQRLHHRDELAEALSRGFAQFQSEELMRICEKGGIPIAPIRNMKEVFDMPAAKALILEETMPDGSISKRVQTAVFKISE
ncbi:MAG: crotonobetainyl-CoA:carnitine CoA-transferase CaiB-like acyl-CoA transferase [Candidatus Azotimanducaceae bacterium]|jgi:crotonobetainyl-CoA:carnitine CoA-transferase CaiB-like acyl-CoA transferase